MPWDEPCRLDFVLVEHLEETADAYGAGEDTSRYITGRVFAAVRAQPSCDRIDVGRDATLDT